MGMASSLTLIANPGSASRKYALYQGSKLRASLHFEVRHGAVDVGLYVGGERRNLTVNLRSLVQAAQQVLPLLHANGVLHSDERVDSVGLRIVAPGSYFLEDHTVTADFTARLEAVKARAPIHVAATLEELRSLRQQFPHARIVGVSDSRFHATKPDYAWNYGIPLEDADKFEIKRFGYHGLSVASVVHELRTAGALPLKLVVCHLGGGSSVSAVLDGASVDTTMGYSPLEGLIMGTRSGSIDPTAVRAIREAHHFDDNAAETYLNDSCGLLGLGGSADIRELLQREAAGNVRAALALTTYVYGIQKAIGEMAAALDGIGACVFTGTVGERSAPIRSRVIARLHYLGFVLDEHLNTMGRTDKSITLVSHVDSKPILIVPAQEASEMARHLSNP